MIENNIEKELLNKVFDDLWPLFRSISGPGIEASLKYLSYHIPLTILKTASGTKVYDWTIPSEWHISRGVLWGPDGSLICDTNDNNLYIVNYSEPVSGIFSLEELMPHLHSLEHLPDAIPYVTSYYKRTWGFCITHNTKQALKPGNYEIKIDSKFVDDGGIPYGCTLLSGESKKEILLTSYLCHPSLANNELSGPLVLLALYNRIKKWPKRRYSYRFLLNPETIGSLCFLKDHHEYLKENLVAGLILTCLGGPSENLHYKQSKCKNTLIDNTLSDSSLTSQNWIIEEFSPINGSDERQYCAPGFNLPVGRIHRTLGANIEYHNSLDTKEYMDMDQVIKSVDQIETLLKLAEISGKAVNQSPFGEPQLGKRGLYPNINSFNSSQSSYDGAQERTQLNSILTILSMSDGKTYMNEIAEQCDSSVEFLRPIIEKLERNKLLKFNEQPLE
jgi:aminopeptidase-like protein